MQSFTKPLTEKYRLQDLDCIVDDFDNDCSEATKRLQLKTGYNYKNIVFYTAGKSILTIKEIIALCNLGYEEGALSLARNLFEQCIVLCFFLEKKSDTQFQDYIDDYCADYNIQRCKNLRYFYEYVYIDTTKKDKYENEQKQCKNNAHRNVKGDYWWSGQGTFSGWVEYVINSSSDNVFKKLMRELHFIYKRSCTTLHANSFGNSNRLGNEQEFVGVNTGFALNGHGTPLWFAVVSFIFVVKETCDVFGIKYDKYKNRLSDLFTFYNDKKNRELYNKSIA